MGKSKKIRNWKARQVVEGVIEEKETKAVAACVVIDNEESGGYDTNNAFALPSKKRKLIKTNVAKTSTKILSKKQRKKLEKIVDRKKKKAERGDLIEKLISVQVSEGELSKLTSLSSVQTKGLKRQFAEDNWINKMNEAGTEIEQIVVNKTEDEIDSQPKKIRLRTKLKLKEDKISENDSNVLGFNDSGSDVDSDSSEDDPERSENGYSSDESVNHLRKEENEISLKEEVEVETKQEKEVQKDVKDLKEEKKATKIIPTRFVPVNRTAEIQAGREKLPILAEEQPIMEAIRENDVVILVGETGSGKTTQIPQFLFEAGYAIDGLIGVTEPRRVAAMAMSQRVATEMNLSSDIVSYQIRFEGNTTENTKIRFMTDGVLLREIERDFLLMKYSVVVIDEAHERSVFTDVLIGILSRIVVKRNTSSTNPLKLIIMSATLRVEDFTENRKLFKTPPPVIKVESRQFDVQTHFNRRTPAGEVEYVNEAFRKVCKIHRTLPDGGILVFVTGQQEVNVLVQKLKRLFPPKVDSDLNDDTKTSQTVDESLEETLKTRGKKKKIVADAILPEVNLDQYRVLPSNDDTEADTAIADDFDVDDEDGDGEFDERLCKLSTPLWTLPLYSLLSSEKQNQIFLPPPSGHRLCVVATNVAETSLTIPGIKYVVDTGKVKTKFYDKVTGVSTFQVTWTSKAQANQRAGRAGRTGPGHCYRLYSSAVFDNDFSSFSTPEIRTRPVEDLVLQLKAMFIDNVANFPFPTPPDAVQIRTAERKLMLLGAIESPPTNLKLFEFEKLLRKSKITKLGKAMAAFPVAPRFGKMLALSHQHNLLPYTITMVAALSLQEVLLERPIGDYPDSLDKNGLIQIRKAWLGKGNSLLLGDPMVLIRAVGAAEYSGMTQEFCDRYGLRFKAMREIRKLRKQLTNEVNMVMPGLNLALDPSLKPPTDLEAKLLRQIVLAGMPDQIAKRIDESDLKDGDDKQKLKHAYFTPDMEEPVFLHETSVLRSERPEFVVYQEIFETTKLYMRGVTVVDASWFATFCPTQCNFSPPLPDPEPRYDSDRGEVLCSVTATFGRRCWFLPRCDIIHPKNVDKFKHLSRFILEGKVIPGLKKYADSLLSNPIVMVKSWSNLQGQRTLKLLEELVENDVDNFSKLQKSFKKNENFIKNAYLNWIPESLKEEVSKAWPPSLQ